MRLGAIAAGHASDAPPNTGIQGWPIDAALPLQGAVRVRISAIAGRQDDAPAVRRKTIDALATIRGWSSRGRDMVVDRSAIQRLCVPTLDCGPIQDEDNLTLSNESAGLVQELVEVESL